MNPSADGGFGIRVDALGSPLILGDMELERLRGVFGEGIHCDSDIVIIQSIEIRENRVRSPENTQCPLPQKCWNAICHEGREVVSGLQCLGDGQVQMREKLGFLLFGFGLGDGFRRSALLFDGRHAAEFPGFGIPQRGSAWTYSFWIRDKAAAPKPVIVLSHGGVSSGLFLELAQYIIGVPGVRKTAALVLLLVDNIVGAPNLPFESRPKVS